MQSLILRALKDFVRKGQLKIIENVLQRLVKTTYICSTFSIFKVFWSGHDLF